MSLVAISQNDFLTYLFKIGDIPEVFTSNPENNVFVTKFFLQEFLQRHFESFRSKSVLFVSVGIEKKEIQTEGNRG